MKFGAVMITKVASFILRCLSPFSVSLSFVFFCLVPFVSGP